MEKLGIKWTQCDSKSDLEAQLQRYQSESLLPIIETEDANSWGFFEIRWENLAILPVVYAELGLKPMAASAGKSLLLLGIAELVAGINLLTGALVFRYRMPTVFHEFVRIDQKGLLIRDETGFVLLTLSGQEVWSFCEDLIEEYNLVDNELEVTTIEGRRFRLKCE